MRSPATTVRSVGRSPRTTTAIAEAMSGCRKT
jgi:hypothetical protein